MLNESDERVINNITKAKELFYKMGGPKIKLYDNGFISMEHIRSMIKVYEPKMVIIDQGDKIMFQGGLKLEGHARLKELYRLFRETAKEFNTHILTVGQASAEASGKKWLEMHHLDNSRTGKPGEMDYIIGIGKTMADEDEELRYINLCKNKLTGRHSKHTLRFNGLTGRYSDL
jgi:ASC-1-like (ASCH) protein